LKTLIRIGSAANRNPPKSNLPGSTRMTTDSTQPQPETGAAPANGTGQQHRRRRRRRKNKSTQQAAPQAIQPQQAQPPQPPSAPRPVQSRAAAPPPKGQARKRKGAFRKASASAPQQQPGNNSNAGSQGKRRGKQKGPREFVGPMDHSYRVANGNVADGPASTIQITTNGHSSHFQDVYAPAPPAPIRADSPTRIFCFIEDLFFMAKIQETARKLGVKVEFVKGDKEAVAKLTGASEEERPALLVFDLNNANAKPLTLIPKFKTKFKKATSIVGFLSHLQGDLKLKAVEAGCDSVMPRSAFSQTLPNLLRRYGLEEEEEYAQQPM
jgi:hypothetical protein